MHNISELEASMEKDKRYWDFINEIVQLKNDIAVQEKELLEYDDMDEREQEEEYVNDGYGLIEDRFLQLISMGYKKEEIEFDIAHAR